MLHLGGCGQPGNLLVTGLRSAIMLRMLRRDRRGVAFLEFALALPIFTTVTMMGLETAWLAVQNQKISQLAAQAADNAARVTGTIDETSIYEITTAARLNGEKIDFMDYGRVIISSVQQNAAKNGQWIRWQRCSGLRKSVSAYGVEGKGKVDASLTGIGTNLPKMTAGPGVAIILAEVEYDYQPIITNAFFGKKVLRSEMAYVVRQRTDLDITNTTALPDAKKLKCT